MRRAIDRDRAMTEESVWFQVRYGAATDTGRHRRFNEDSYLAAAPVFVVADGMGGHAGGAVASRTAVDAFVTLTSQTLVSPDEVRQSCIDAAHEVAALATPHSAPGSTLAGVALTEQSGRAYWMVFNIGDSRVYLFRGGRLEQISVDHSRVQELLDAGTPPSDIHVGRNVITRALGGGQMRLPSADHWLVPALEGDRFVLCTDGLTSEVTDLLIQAIVGSASHPQTAADDLVRAAVTAGGRDNVTAVVVDAIEIEGDGIVADLDADTVRGDPRDMSEDDTAQREPEEAS